jgi:O-antigen/teichoic acid export membrane protein
MAELSPFRNISIRNMFQKGFWAVMDQGLFASSNFFLNVFLARWLSLKEYGTFAITFSVLLLLGTLHTALLTEPMLIYGAGKYKERDTEYFANLFRGHFYLSLFFSFLLIIVFLVLSILHKSDYAQAFLGLSLAQPFIFLVWLLRRACYTRFIPRIAAVAGLGYLILTLSGSFMLYNFKLLSSLSALLLMGFSSLCVGIWMIYYMFSPNDLCSGTKIEKEMLTTHLNYGRWSLPSSVLTWMPANIYYVLLPILGNVDLVAILRAQNNLIMPLLQFNTALSTQLIPTFVLNKDRTNYNNLINGLIAFFVAISLAFWVALNILRNDIILIVYGAKFLKYSELLLILGLLPLMTGIIAVLGGVIRADDRPDKIFWAYFIASLSSVTIGLWFMVSWGLMGVASAILLSYAIVVVIMFYYIYLKH